MTLTNQKVLIVLPCGAQELYTTPTPEKNNHKYLSSVGLLAHSMADASSDMNANS